MTTPNVLAFFGAGPGLAVSTAQRFAREGYKIALVARNKTELEQRVLDLKAAGIDAAAFPFDLTNTQEFPSLVSSIEDRLGAITTAVYAPVGDLPFAPATDLTGAAVKGMMDLLTYGPIDLWRQLAQRMLQRGKGALVVVDGLSAVMPFAGLSGPGPAMAATANYVRTLNLELADKGVFAGLMHITAIIERSKSYAAFAGSGEMPNFPMVHPDALAEELWRLVAQRDAVETIFPPLPKA